MLHTIQADFYRLFRSKGFWISEFFLILNIISGVFFLEIQGTLVSSLHKK
ncbi:hypothetical protein SMU66_05859 [Streptococcus mutans N34]|nr:hypothetical protein SMU66_05859 [Streptococcus mutans N34]